MLRDRAGLIDRLRSSRLDPRSIDQALSTAAEVASEIEHATGATTQSLLGNIVERVEIGSDALTIRLDCHCLLNKVADDAEQLTDLPVGDMRFDLRLSMRFKRRGSELKLVLAEREQSASPDRSLISNLARGFSWAEELRSGIASSQAAIAGRENISPAFIRRCCDLAFLPTELIESIAAGRQAIQITSEAFKRLYPMPIRWNEQRGMLDPS